MTQKRKSTSVPGQALGYFTQETIMTELLASGRPGSRVSLEVFEDVGVEEATGAKKFVQTKSALTGNPLSDRAIPFWKTLANWAVDLKKADFSDLDLVLYIAKPRSDSPESIADRFNRAATTEAATAAIAEIRGELAAELASQAKDDTNAAFHIKRFFATPPAVQAEIVRCFRIKTSTRTPQEDLPERFPFIPPAHLDDTVAHAQGWVKREAELLMEKGEPAIISRDAFHAEMTAYIRKHRERAILRSVAPATVPPEKQAELLPSTFVRQLEIVNAEFEDRMQAVSDFFRAAADRTKWGETAEVHQTSFDEFEESLQRTWQNLRRASEIQHMAHPEDKRGLLLFSECSNHKAELAGQIVPNHFIPGTFHTLANQERVGWHPRYREVLAATPKQKTP